jgi:hypothetical protein
MRLNQGNIQVGAWEQFAGGAGPPWHVYGIYNSMWDNPLGQGKDMYWIGNKVVTFPIYFGRSAQYNRIGCYVAYHPQSSTDNIRLGIYEDDITKVYPGKLLLDSGIIACSGTSTGIMSATIDFKPGAGRLYWIAFTHSETNPGYVYYVGGWPHMFPSLGFAAMGNSLGFKGGYQIDRNFQALPDPFPGGGVGVSRHPALGVRYVT